jgi:hypothetical protein
MYNLLQQHDAEHHGLYARLRAIIHVFPYYATGRQPVRLVSDMTDGETIERKI